MGVIPEAAATALDRSTWQELAHRHEQRAERVLAGVRDRRRRGIKHPVEDFLFHYYNLRPGDLSAWHPGAGVWLEDAAEYAERRHYVEVGGLVGVDVDAFLAQRRSTVETADTLLRAIQGRPAAFGCFGMHEWAMVYRRRADETRHAYLPLRFEPAEVAAVVESVGLRCTHFDAFRFFTPEAKPLNTTQLTREGQVEVDQPGCLHVSMDCYRWASKLMPAVSSDLVWACFELALEVRELDMRASAYDLRDWGYEPVKVETPAGRAEYVAAQRLFTRRAEPLRHRLLDATGHLLSHASGRRILTGAGRCGGIWSAGSRCRRWRRTNRRRPARRVRPAACPR